MDLYLINGHDGISLPEMIDWDIKLCDSDISKEVGVNNSLGLGYDLPSLDIEEDPNSLWTQSYSANSNSSFELDFLGEGASSLMVDPISVMPFVTSRRGVQAVDHLKDEPSQENDGDYNEADQLQTDPCTEKDEVKLKGELILPEMHEDQIEDETMEPNVNVDEVNEQKITFELKKSADIMTLPIEFVNVQPSENSYIEVMPAKKTTPQKRQVVPTLNNMALKSYPKPAYSYSCLIAMALKNSQTGSLPVSEIYSFMCHHFPYFKTAPNGWKNSVRHNLSLNKCFEKIEKPPGSGNSGSQRKGCLWAMNPAKITKMDDEVAKWSRKDPSAIKKAMIFPDNLELLERGELKDDAAFGGDETEEESEEVKEEEVEDDLGIDVEDERISPIDDDSEDEISTIPPSLQPFEPRFHNLNRHKLLQNRIGLIGKSSDIIADVDFEVNDRGHKGAGGTDTRTLLGLDESTPIYAVDPNDENLLIELPLVKRPRVQGNYIYQPVMNVKRHNIGGFRSLKIQTP